MHAVVQLGNSTIGLLSSNIIIIISMFFYL